MRIQRQQTPVKAQIQGKKRPTPVSFHWRWSSWMVVERFASVTEIAEAEGFDLGRASRIARLAQLAQLAQLASSIVEACATGTAAGLTLESVSRRAIPQRWDQLRERLRLA